MGTGMSGYYRRIACVGDRVLVTRTDGVREVVCESCYTPNGIIENVDVPSSVRCATEVAPGSWDKFWMWPREINE